MQLVYIAGRYRGKDPNEVYENIQFARTYGLKYWRLGYSVITPHMNTAFMDEIGTDQKFLEGDLEMLRRCDIVVMIPGWQESVGAKGEHMLALELDKEVIYEFEE